MDIFWTNIGPGEIPVVDMGDAIEVVLPGGLQSADWIRLPEELGGTEHRILCLFLSLCVCGCSEVVHAGLEGTDIRVCECPNKKQFLWYHEVSEAPKKEGE